MESDYMFDEIYKILRLFKKWLYKTIVCWNSGEDDLTIKSSEVFRKTAHEYERKQTGIFEGKLAYWNR